MNFTKFYKTPVSTEAATEGVLSKKMFLIKNFANFTGKHLCLSPFFNKVAGIQACNFIKKRCEHRCFSV